MSDMADKLAAIRHVVVDMDGVIYRGDTVFECTRPFLKLLEKLDIGHTFLTNNSSHSAAEYLRRLEQLGITTRKDQLYTSTQSTIEYLRAERPDVSRLFVLGTPSLCGEFTAAGFEVVNDKSDAVVVGFDKTLTYDRLCRAAYLIADGKEFIATHRDLICPTDKPTVLVDCGAICAALTAATGCEPTFLGKPDVQMIRGVLARHNLRADQLAVIGDRIYTDMVMAHKAGALGVLVLTGEATAETAAEAEAPPDLIVADVGEFGRMLAASRDKR